MDWIQGQKFWEIADMIFTPKILASDDYYNLPNTFNVHRLNNNSIIYTHTMYIKQLFAILELFSEGEIIIISHNSDINVDTTFQIPSCVKKWFTTNVNVINSKIESIPIGLENDRWFPKLNKRDQMQWQVGQEYSYKNLVYMNFNIQTNVSKRQEVYDVLKDKSWVTKTRCNCKNGREFNDYIYNVYRHKFVVCPEGNGIDTHRIWETLFMGSIPIVLSSINISFYERLLSILVVDNWNELTVERLQEVFTSILKVDFDSSVLTFEYWKNKILKERK